MKRDTRHIISFIFSHAYCFFAFFALFTHHCHSVHAECLVSYRPPRRVIKEYGYAVTFVDQVLCSMHGTFPPLVFPFCSFV